MLDSRPAAGAADLRDSALCAGELKGPTFPHLVSSEVLIKSGTLRELFFFHPNTPPTHLASAICFSKRKGGGHKVSGFAGNGNGVSWMCAQEFGGQRKEEEDSLTWKKGIWQR